MSINDAEHTISALREALNTLAEHTISALREALNTLIDSHEQLLLAMTDHGACEDGFEDDIAALAAARIVAIAAANHAAAQWSRHERRAAVPQATAQAKPKCSHGIGYEMVSRCDTCVDAAVQAQFGGPSPSLPAPSATATTTTLHPLVCCQRCGEFRGHGHDETCTAAQPATPSPVSDGNCKAHNVPWPCSACSGPDDYPLAVQPNHPPATPSAEELQAALDRAAPGADYLAATLAGKTDKEADRAAREATPSASCNAQWSGMDPCWSFNGRGWGHECSDNLRPDTEQRGRQPPAVLTANSVAPAVPTTGQPINAAQEVANGEKEVPDVRSANQQNAQAGVSERGALRGEEEGQVVARGAASKSGAVLAPCSGCAVLRGIWAPVVEAVDAYAAALEQRRSLGSYGIAIGEAAIEARSVLTQPLPESALIDRSEP